MINVIPERTPQIIAAEIISYQEPIRKIRLICAIEIGRRLTEAKELIPYGDWQKWLEESVNYSKSTATRLMQIAREYGPALLTSSSGNGSSNDATLHDLSYSQALILLDIPKEERAQFLAGLDIDNMSVRELQKAVKERDQAQHENADLRKTLDDQAAAISQLTGNLDSLKTEVEGLRESEQAFEQKLKTKKEELQETKKSAGYLCLLDMSDKLTTAHNRAQAGKMAFLYEDLEKTLKELLRAIKESAETQPEVHTAYKEKLNVFLGKAMKEIKMSKKVTVLKS